MIIIKKSKWKRLKACKRACKRIYRLIYSTGKEPDPLSLIESIKAELVAAGLAEHNKLPGFKQFDPGDYF